MRLNRLVPFTELIERSGYEPSTDPQITRVDKATADDAGPLQVEAGTQCVIAQRLLRADGQPVIDVVDVVPTVRLQRAANDIRRGGYDVRLPGSERRGPYRLRDLGVHPARDATRPPLHRAARDALLRGQPADRHLARDGRGLARAPVAAAPRTLTSTTGRGAFSLRARDSPGAGMERSDL